MAHSLLVQLLQKIFKDNLKEDKANADIFNEWSKSRRDFIKNTAISGGGLFLFSDLLSACSLINGKDKHVVIAGAGISGLNASFHLQKLGIQSTIYEASGRVGGRMFTMKDMFGKGLTTEVGGEFVDTTHAEILSLAKELGLSFYDIRTDALSPKTYFFEGKNLSDTDLKNALKPFIPQLVKDISSLPPEISHETAASFEHLDKVSITEYLTSIGIKGWLYNFLNVVLTREYGMEAAEQSAINLLIMFDPPAESNADYELFGESHEVYKIKGGSEALTNTLYEKVKGNVQLNHQLISIGKGASKKYMLVFDNDGNKITVESDFVIITIPFSILRNIPFTIEMPEGKKKCIQEIGYGNSCKFIMGVNNRTWRNAGKQGYTFTDTGFGCGWDSSQFQQSEQGSFTVFGGGKFGDDMKDSTKEQLISKYLPSLNTIYPGTTTAFNNIAVQFCWTWHPYVKGGYSSFSKGQWSTLAGWEAVPVGDIYFAGEHVSRDFQGYMNGAAQTAKDAVTQIINKIKQ
jgi:monoamine oxidase